MLNKFKPDKKSLPLPTKMRVAPPLEVGNLYYVSFVSNIAYECKLTEIITQSAITEVKIEVQGREKKMIIFQNGMKSHDYIKQHIVNNYEIGLTPEDAVKNQVLKVIV